MRKGEWWQVVTPPIAEEMLFRWLAEQFLFPEKIWRRLNASGGIQFSRNQRLSLRLFPAEESKWIADFEPLEVVYEDDFVVVVNKEAGVKVHPTESDEQATLLHRLAGHWALSGEEVSARVVHRLDRDTSGLIVFAKCELAQHQLDEAVRARRLERVYYALVHGSVAAGNGSGTIDAPIGRDRHRDRYRVTERGGQSARTHYRVVWAKGEHSLLELRLETGRTHQIRVHLSHIGHPLLGDELYGGSLVGIDRQALHAARLAFPHPWSGEMVRCEAPLPADFAAMCDIGS